LHPQGSLGELQFFYPDLAPDFGNLRRRYHGEAAGAQGVAKRVARHKPGKNHKPPTKDEQEEHRLQGKRDGKWFVRAVNRLIEYGHQLDGIGNYTLSQFLIHLDAVDQNQSRDRIQTITDMQMAIGSLLVEDSGLEHHTDLLRLAARGA
jgi:hypothetical protein